MKRTRLAVVLGFILVLSAQAAMAAPVTVYVGNTSPALVVTVNLPGVYSGGAYAGVENLTINGKAFQAFCIDLSHLAKSGATLQYTINDLGSSPVANPPGAMGDQRADFIARMWEEYFTTSWTAASAAAFQVAVWGVVMGNFDASGQLIPGWTWLTSSSPTHYGADALIAWTNANPNAPMANVFGLNPLAGGQAYAVQGIPDGGTTVMLLGGALMALGALRRRFSA